MGGFIIKKMKTTTLVLCAFFAALSAILSQIFIPVGLVPIGLVHISVFLAAGLLGAKYGAVSQIVYVFLGLAGAPVFTGFRGGPGVLAGPTGGFIAGYIGCAFVTGLIIDRFGYSIKALIPAMYVGWVVTYSMGLPWFMYVTNLSLIASLPVCVFPFLPGDLVKTILCAVLVNRLRISVRLTA